MTMRLLLQATLLLLPVSLPAGAQEGGAWPPVEVPAGRYVPQFAADTLGVEVDAFRLDATPVTVSDFVDFLSSNPSWRRSRVPAAFAGDAYLASWHGDLEPGLEGDDLRRPVTEVTWFAARAYCRWRGARLPTTDEWEYVASAGEEGPVHFRDRDFDRRLQALYAARPAPGRQPPVGGTSRNHLGILDLHGLVWEWTSDFNNQMATGAGRDDQGLDRGLFCAAGSEGATDRADYAAFLRYAFRASLAGDSAGPLLGFRCAL